MVLYSIIKVAGLHTVTAGCAVTTLVTSVLIFCATQTDIWKVLVISALVSNNDCRNLLACFSLNLNCDSV